MDFTLNRYKQLLLNIRSSGYSIQTFEEFIKMPSDKGLVLRHDVDRIPANALKMAKIESELGIKATYYFRVIPSVFKEEIISKIIDLGHEFGYHYEDMDLARGNIESAYNKFQNNLKKFRELYPVTTICMHGSPLSKWDNRAVWEKYSYRDFGIIAEPYFDVDYSKVLYITDTGRQWNNDSISVRDKVSSDYNYRFKNSNAIISMIHGNESPVQIIINTHPHRWFDNKFFWLRELLFQNLKNIVKAVLIRLK